LPECRGGRRVIGVLCVIDGRGADRQVVGRAVDLATEHHARLALIRLWNPNPWVYFAHTAPTLIAQQEDEEGRMLRAVASRLPADLPCTTFCCRRGAIRDELDNLAAGSGGWLVAGGRVLSRRRRARLRRLNPNLRVIVADASE
jgi:hypothetical protein